MRLTTEGRELVDRAVTDHVANEARLLEPLSPTERAALDRALRTLLRQFDTTAPAPEGESNNRGGRTSV